jgi:PAS domain S-box-containing protein
VPSNAYRALFEAHPAPMWAYDLETLAFLAVNDAAVAHYGYSRDEFLAMTIADIRPPEDVPALLDAIPEDVDAGLDETGTWRHLLKDGTMIDVRISSHTLMWEGRPAEVVTAEDITERLEIERELQEYRAELEETVRARTAELVQVNEALEQAPRAKSEFLASMSHELRTPLNTIIGFSSILIQGMAGELNEEQHKQLEMVLQAGKRLLALVNEVLDLSRIEAGRVEVLPDSIDVAPMLMELAEQVRPQAEAKGLELDLKPCEAPKQIRSDRRKIEQILLNLLSNAVKFTESGTVTFTASCDGKQRCVFTVADTGIGIPEDELELIFDEFHQMGIRNDPAAEGTGLGLAISRRLATLLGGSLTVESRVGEGSTFTLTVPRVLSTSRRAR